MDSLAGKPKNGKARHRRDRALVRGLGCRGGPSVPLVTTAGDMDGDAPLTFAVRRDSWGMECTGFRGTQVGGFGSGRRIKAGLTHGSTSEPGMRHHKMT